MKNLFTFIRNHHEEIYKIFLFVVAIILIVFMLPKDARFKYEFQKGKPWLHENLITPFNFAVYKSPESLKDEQQKIKKNSKVYFQKKNEIKNSSISKFEKSFWQKWNETKVDTNFIFGSSKKYQSNLKLGSNLLGELFDRGILMHDDILENKSKYYTLSIVEDNVESETELGQFFNIKTAQQYIEANLKNEYYVEFLKPLLYENLSQNVVYNDELTQKVLSQNLANISLTKGRVEKNSGIINKGDIVDDQLFMILSSYKKEYEKRLGGSQTIWIYVGQLLMVSLCFFLLIQFMILYRTDLFESSGKILFLILLIILMVFSATQALKFNINIYIVPLCILPIVLRAFYDSRLALYVHIITTLIIGYFAPNAFEFVFIHVIAGAISIFSISKLRNRSQFFLTSGIIFLVYCLTFLSLGFMQEGNVYELNYYNLKWFGANAVLTLLIYPLIYVFEKLFNFVSDITLLELSDTNSDLLKKLAQTAPGTFQHSLQVANLAEAATEKIGGNTLLVRTGALYHDIGKMKTPYYFIENQSTEVNPHDDIAFDESASIIIDHVTDGVEMAKKHSIPDVIIDFIRTHHGTSLVQYFYQSFLKSYPDQIVDESRFKYPGPLPYSKETAVLMMADSVEAASRSLKNKNSETIKTLVGKIIDSQLEYGQFSNSNITLKDLKTIKKIFTKMLMNIYHVRIEY